MTTTEGGSIDSTKAIDDAITNINQKLEEKFQATDSKLESVTNTIMDELRTPKKGAEAPKPRWLDDSEEDEGETYLTRKEFRSAVKEIARDITVESTKTARQLDEEKMQKQMHDAQVFREFPMLDETSIHYRPEFNKEVVADMTRRCQAGRSMEDVDLLADAAQRVWGKWVQQGRLVPQHFAEGEHQRTVARTGALSMGDGGASITTAPNSRQIALASQVGLSKERLMQLLERNKKIG